MYARTLLQSSRRTSTFLAISAVSSPAGAGEPSRLDTLSIDGRDGLSSISACLSNCFFKRSTCTARSLSSDSICPRFFLAPSDSSAAIFWSIDDTMSNSSVVRSAIAFSSASLMERVSVRLASLSSRRSRLASALASVSSLSFSARVASADAAFPSRASCRSAFWRSHSALSAATSCSSVARVSPIVLAESCNEATWAAAAASSADV
mmetsp:Transcript_32739/g.85692  ORF Transcript_32739/g.85692 Transcript_32739/m.85692 type:complete len:207 (+) Transcript_32739:139-759(+)